MEEEVHLVAARFRAEAQLAVQMAQDFDAICTGLQALAVSHAAGEWHIGLDDEGGGG